MFSTAVGCMELEDGEIPEVGAPLNRSCSVCSGSDAKYKCSRCLSARFCSVGCSSKHQMHCKKACSEFISVANFTDDQLAKERSRDSVDRLRRHSPVSNCSLPKGKISLRNAARERGCTLTFMSAALSRHRQNRSFYSRQRDEIVWSLEIIEPSGKRFIPACSEKELLGPILKTEGEAVLVGCGKGDEPLREDFLVTREAMKCTLREFLGGKRILEFPAFRIL